MQAEVEGLTELAEKLRGANTSHVEEVARLRAALEEVHRGRTEHAPPARMLGTSLLPDGIALDEFAALLDAAEVLEARFVQGDSTAGGGVQRLEEILGLLLDDAEMLERDAARGGADAGRLAKLEVCH